jgi:hypothetical protein
MPAVRRSARAGDDYLDAARFGARCKLGHPYRRPVRRHDVLFELDAKLLEHVGRVLHRFQSDDEPMMTATSG